MPYLYGIADTKFLVKKLKKKISYDVTPIKFQRRDFLKNSPKFNLDDVPIQFRCSPPSLLELCVNAVDKLPLSSVFEWDDMDIRRWIKSYGYPEYMNTFRENMIWGRKLLLLDAAALSAMNIKDFDHIRHIAYGIRMLFHFELTRWSHSISLPDEKPNELYLLFHTQTGINYDEVRRSDLYRRMKLLSKRSPNLDHWDLLDMWLRRERERKCTVKIGQVPRYSMFKCEKPKVEQLGVESHMDENVMCRTCIPPCDCDWTERDNHLPWRLSCLAPAVSMSRSKWLAMDTRCNYCIPPCECRWPSRYYLTGTVMKCLQVKFPEKFCPIFDERMRATARPSLVERWTRFSF
ncbi:uncharacterized protein [Drosophila tropicalis]|uniref:uncharacterized protein n=1 Tax=Drosophila tropicalis TaxID=46794 RepID=UPI0035ABBFA7